ADQFKAAAGRADGDEIDQGGAALVDDQGRGVQVVGAGQPLAEEQVAAAVQHRQVGRAVAVQIDADRRLADVEGHLRGEVEVACAVADHHGDVGRAAVGADHVLMAVEVEVGDGQGRRVDADLNLD